MFHLSSQLCLVIFLNIFKNSPFISMIQIYLFFLICYFQSCYLFIKMHLMAALCNCKTIRFFYVLSLEISYQQFKNFDQWDFKMFNLICAQMISISVLYFIVTKPNNLFGLVMLHWYFELNPFLFYFIRIFLVESHRFYNYQLLEF